MALKIFELVGSVFVDTGQAEKSLQKTDKQAGNFGQTLAKGIGTAAKWAAGMAAAAGTAAVALGKAAIESYADYEQLVGGVETLFKDSANLVQQYADNAYKTAGLSANDYMETVTSFSASLLQSLDGDTAAAAKAADAAITDMADNANKMGTSMESIQYAYQGFAKQNYTMLDNLKLGYGGTKEEMERLLADATAISGIEYNMDNLADVYEAIHVIQTELGITGTTAAEAEKTITGSLNAMKSSWSNLLTALASEDMNVGEYVTKFVDTVAVFADNLMPRISAVLGGVVQLVDKLAPEILGRIPEILSTLLPSLVGAIESICAVLPDLFSGVLTTLEGLAPELLQVGLSLISSLISAFLSQLPSITKTLMKLLGDAFVAVGEILPSLVESLLDAAFGILTNFAEYLPDAIASLSQMFIMLAEALPGMFQLISDRMPELIAAIGTALQESVPQLLEAVVLLVTLLIDQIPVLIPQLLSMVVTLVQMLTEQLPVLLPQIIAAAVTIVNLLVEQLPVLIPMLISACITAVLAITNALPTILQSLISALPSALGAVWDAIVMVFKGLPAWFGQLFEGAVAIIFNVFSGVPGWFGLTWEDIKKFFAPAGEFFKNLFTTAWNNIKNSWSGVKSFFSGIWSGIKNAFGSVSGWFKDTFSKAWQKVKDVFSTGGKIFDGIKDGIANVFKNVVNGLIGGINKVIAVPFKAINSALSRIKGIEIVGIKPFDWIKTFEIPEIPKLEQGGVLERGQIGLLEGNGAEAVVPLHQNRAWINEVAKDMNGALGGDGQVVALLTDILEALEEIAGMGITLDTGALVGGLAKPMDRRLGQIQAQKARG